MKNEIQIDLQPVQTRRASEEIYNQIRQLILDGEIHPGGTTSIRTKDDGYDASQSADDPGGYAYAGAGRLY